MTETKEEPPKPVEEDQYKLIFLVEEWGTEFVKVQICVACDVKSVKSDWAGHITVVYRIPSAKMALDRIMPKLESYEHKDGIFTVPRAQYDVFNEIFNTGCGRGYLALPNGQEELAMVDDKIKELFYKLRQVPPPANMLNILPVLGDMAQHYDLEATIKFLPSILRDLTLIVRMVDDVQPDESKEMEQYKQPANLLAFAAVSTDFKLYPKLFGMTHPEDLLAEIGMLNELLNAAKEEIRIFDAKLLKIEEDRRYDKKEKEREAAKLVKPVILISQGKLTTFFTQCKTKLEPIYKDLIILRGFAERMYIDDRPGYITRYEELLKKMKDEEEKKH